MKHFRIFYCSWLRTRIWAYRWYERCQTFQDDAKIWLETGLKERLWELDRWEWKGRVAGKQVCFLTILLPILQRWLSANSFLSFYIDENHWALLILSVIFWLIAELPHWLMGPECIFEKLGKTSILLVVPIVTPLNRKVAERMTWSILILEK